MKNCKMCWVFWLDLPLSEQLRVYPNVLDRQLLIKGLCVIQKYMKQKVTIVLLIH